ncbi:hypothetical protein HYALB_00001924 [Hymenoscyphus albidus]|uniref:Urea amidolyase n=1 Tax=Hymenoscyphus albidus TaxID=595503 RepID=A0A9N9LGC3_9HELO|nr:hypothetical protein HYALB_00001924 [Hymenoscyphus albidus]
MSEYSNSEGKSPLTIEDWKLAQATGNQLSRLLNHLESLDSSDIAWISLVPKDHIQLQWESIELFKDQGHSLPLYGVPFAVKDNIDVAGLPTTAACPDFAYTPKKDASVVRTLQRAGAIVIGKTNLDAFATGLVGTRSPFGAVPNTFNPEYVSGGSSSGSASVVARGLVPFALGTDTAGSGRVPAGLNNIIGLKATRGAISARGVVPACRSLDCVSIMALTLKDASLVFDVAAAYDPEDGYSRHLVKEAVTLTKTPRIAICDNPPWFGGDIHCQAYLEALNKAQSLGWQLEPVNFSTLFQLAALLYDGPWVAERYAAIKDFINKPGVKIDPTVLSIIKKAENFSAVDCFENEYLKIHLIRSIENQFKDFDAVLVPTSPTFPTLEEVRKEPVLENSRLGQYTNFVNFLDWSALSVPAGFRIDGLPFGLTIISTRWQEQKLLQLGSQMLSVTSRLLGATRVDFHEQSFLLDLSQKTSDHLLVVVGAHLSGLPLNYQLHEAGATFKSSTKTAPSYRLFDLPSTNGIRKPGLKRVSGENESGGSIDVETWQISDTGLGSLMKLVPHPLAVGSVEIVDGTWLKGFVCEPCGLEEAAEITKFGGWRAYMNSLETLGSISTESNPKSPPFKSILIANRGEIAVRIISTLKKLGIRSIAIYSSEDSGSQHVQDADEAFLLQGDTLAETYLSEKAILNVAEISNSEAVIPGYGFLSESAEFASVCETKGLIWIGPTPEQMQKLGLKHLARDLARSAGVPLLPGTSLVSDVETACREAESIGYPIIVKSSAGGGGIGLQKCSSPKALVDSFESIRHLGNSFFNDNRVFIEKFVESGRHVEVQIIGDGNGRVKHVGERDCSLQRRKQKVIEEGPAIFIPTKTREQIRQAAVNLAAKVHYRGVGTVEFIYDLQSKEFYFLEVNTRLQVEHTVTECMTGLDLVETMIHVAAGNAEYLFDPKCDFPIKKVAIEARIYAESPLQDFRPSSGQLLDVSFPDGVRIDTWVKSGTMISPSYDPLLGKLIVSGFDRPEAVRKLSVALNGTKITGIETNLEYLKKIVESEPFLNGTYKTTSLNTFKFGQAVFEVIESGPSTLIQDFPGRLGYWHIGIPPSGPMDNYAFQLANRVLGNDLGAAALECGFSGPTLLFHQETVISVVAGKVSISIDGSEAPLYRAIKVLAGQKVQIGKIEAGCRAYVAVKGGIHVPEVFGSRSTFTLGKMGGHNGRELRAGDLIPFKIPLHETSSSLIAQPPSYNSLWEVKVMPGPHAFPDYFAEGTFKELFSKPWKVHYNSNRVGVRLTGSTPEWARKSGGEAGIHPSNIHDSPYSIGSISFTGDQAVILTCDGPSLGGFMVFATVISAEMWKIGQMKPGDEILLCPVTASDAMLLAFDLQSSIETLEPLREASIETKIYDPILASDGTGKDKISYRQAGDAAILLEFGNEVFDIRTSFKIQAIMESHKNNPMPGILELTPGVRSLHISYNPTIPQATILSTLREHITSSFSNTLKTTLPSRTFHLPLAIEHPSTLEAITRYGQTIRPSAPWVPSNTSFLREINGLPSNSVLSSTLSTTFLILGLGDVFLGSPCAIPLDPRNRLFGMKYNPPRSFTPEGAVGIGGQYMCIYAIDSPGGYQLVGRTVPIWKGGCGGGEREWMFDVFDRVVFYAVEESELDRARETGTGSELVRVEEGVFDLEVYEAWLEENREDIVRVSAERWRVLNESDGVAEAMRFLPPSDVVQNSDSLDESSTGIVIRSGIAGKCWKCAVSVGDTVEAGQILFSIEAMKMEIKIPAPSAGFCTSVFVKTGDILGVNTQLAMISDVLS